jgi:hypothetical protein
MPSECNASMSGEGKAEENFYRSEGNNNKNWKSSYVASSSCSRKSEKHRFSDIDLDWDKTFEDTFITGFEVADLKNRIQVENLFVFDK